MDTSLPISDPFFMFLNVTVGVFWTLAYILIIRRGFRDKSFGMPIAACCANVAWEFVYAFLYPPFFVQGVINTVWFTLDLVILYQIYLYGPRYFEHLFPRRVFRAYVTLGLIVAFGGMLVFGHMGTSLLTVALAQSILISAGYVQMITYRKSSEGQSLYIALCRWVTPVCSTPLCIFYFPTAMNYFLLAVITTFDLIYLVLLVKTLRREAAECRRVPIGKATLTAAVAE